MIYIQSNSERTTAHHFDAASAQFGAIETGQSYRLTTFQEVESGKLNQLIRTSLFVGSVEFMREVFSKIGLNVKLPTNSNRVPKISKLGDIREKIKQDNNQKWFIKPLTIKLFTGFIFDKWSLSSISGIDDDCDIMVYDVFDSQIKSEWRCYIHMDKVVDIRNYSGDLFTIPDKNYLEEIIKQNRDVFPIAYTIDIGILENSQNVVVEYNDMWAIGNYGMPNDLYLRLLKDRYFEIIRFRRMPKRLYRLLEKDKI
jgi:ATP-grasp domain, R2K clade family 2